MVKTTLDRLQKEVADLKKEVYNIKQMIVMKPELSEETIAEIEAARKEMKIEWLSHQDMIKEFVKHV